MPADLLIRNARVLTMDGSAPRAEAVAITGNLITAVGRDSDVAAYRGPRTTIIDAGGKTLLPGFIESHLHIFMGGATLTRLSLDGLKGFDAMASAIRAWAATHPDEPLIFAMHTSYQILGDPIDRHALDRILPDRPLAVYAYDGHTVWANTRALEVAGLLHGRALRPGNEIVMGRDGRATGELREPEAFAPLFALLPTGGREALGYTTGRDPDPVPSPADRVTDRATIKRGLDYCASLGITSIHNMDGNSYQLGLLEELDDAGALACRVQLPYHQKNDKTIADLVEGAPAMRARNRPDRITTNFVKVFVDGVLDSTTALMLDDYAGKPGWKGDALFTQEALSEVAIAADRLGFQIAIHSIGDGGVRRSLNAFEAARRANGARDSRHRVEHIEVIDPADIPRFRELGVIASMQPLHAPGPLSYDGTSLMGLLGEARQPFAFAWNTLRAAGARLCFASDWPVSPLDPLRSICAAVTRERFAPSHPDQAQTLMQALEGYTIDGAYAEFAEDRKGRVTPGFLADLVLLDTDIEAVAPADIVSIKAAMTICDGRITHGG
ncbi:MAG: amidohydrolase [Labrys sp. (in: a-proteobacteria)]